MRTLAVASMAFFFSWAPPTAARAASRSALLAATASASWLDSLPAMRSFSSPSECCFSSRSWLSLRGRRSSQGGEGGS